MAPPTSIPEVQGGEQRNRARWEWVVPDPTGSVLEAYPVVVGTGCWLQLPHQTSTSHELLGAGQ